MKCKECQNKMYLSHANFNESTDEIIAEFECEECGAVEVKRFTETESK